MPIIITYNGLLQGVVDVLNFESTSVSYPYSASPEPESPSQTWSDTESAATESPSQTLSYPSDSLSVFSISTCVSPDCYWTFADGFARSPEEDPLASYWEMGYYLGAEDWYTSGGKAKFTVPANNTWGTGALIDKPMCDTDHKATCEVSALPDDGGQRLGGLLVRGDTFPQQCYAGVWWDEDPFDHPFLAIFRYTAGLPVLLASTEIIADTEPTTIVFQVENSGADVKLRLEAVGLTLNHTDLAAESPHTSGEQVGFVAVTGGYAKEQTWEVDSFSSTTVTDGL